MDSVEISNLVLRATALTKTNWLHAVYILEQALDEYPDNLRILLNLGEIYLERQIFVKALGYFQKAIAVKPNDPYILTIIGNCYYATGEYRLALSYYNKITDVTPEVLYNTALCLTYLGMNKESITVLDKLIQFLPDNPFIHFMLIEQYMRIQNYETAFQYLTKAEKRFGNHKQLLLLSAILHAKRGIWLKAYHCFAEYNTMNRIVNPEQLIAYSQAAQKIGMDNRAVELLKSALSFNPYISSTYEELVRLQLQMNDYKGARESMKLAKKHLVRISPVLKILQERIHNEE
ncbi:MAG: tetratricopeptide repeat protein [Candidatus Cloacimonetes bacterium]|nr:tetratricopeptide repeat protein [Candidatus Cloacimonadota bacterium]